jgi:putative transposase
LLGINRSTLYYKGKEPDEAAKLFREHVMARIDYWHTKMPALGSRKIDVLLWKEGLDVGRKMVRNCMAEMGISAIYPKENLSKRNFKQAIVPYLLRNCQIRHPNQAWSVDITYIKMYHSHMYLTAVIDWFSRKIVGWHLSDTLDTDSVIITVKNAISTHGLPEILNSDQGCQFTSDEYKGFLKEQGIRQSMDGKSRWADNIMIERWFRSLKTEKIYINEYHSPKALRKDLADFILEYNDIRPHQALGYETPSKVFAEWFTPAA